MMSDKSKLAGKGDKERNANMTNKAGRSNSVKGRWQGAQGRGGGLNTPPRAPRHSTRLNSNVKDKDAQANEEAEAQATNPFHVLQMEEDEESEEEESEEIKDMQISPARYVPRTPQRRTQKRFEREDSSVGSIHRPTKGGKLEIVDTIDMGVELEGKRTDMDVSTITSSPEDDDLLMMEDTKKTSFQYDDNPTQVDLMYSKPL